MPTLIVENVPVETYERLQERAAAEQRSVPEEALHLLNQLVRKAPIPAPRLPDFIPGEEMPAPYDLPRASQPVTMSAAWGQPRLPDAVDEDAPE
jgi:plasmid stability protein